MKNKLLKNKTLICYSLLFFTMTLFYCILVHLESDYYWHIKAGEVMVKTKSILTKDIFSWYVSGRTWVSHEWLFEVIIYYLKMVFGSYHIYIYSFSTIFCLLMLLFFSKKDDYLKNVSFSLLWSFLSIVILCYTQVRPQLISYIFLALTVYFSYDLYERKESRKIYFLPLVALLWSNIHGGSSNLSYIIPVVFLLAGSFDFSFKKIYSTRISNKQIVKYLLVILMCVLAICINPSGIGMLFYPYQNMMDGFMLKTISEWQPTNLNDITHYFYIFIILLLIIVFIFSDKRLKFIDFLLFGISVFMGFKSVRFWIYTYIIMNFVVFNYISFRKNDKGTNLILIVLSLIIFSAFIFSVPNMDKVYSKSKIISDSAISVLKNEKPKRLYNYYDYGGYLLYNNIDVFIDGRADLYSKYNYKDYYNISVMSSDYNKLIKKYNFDYFIIPNNLGLNTYLNSNDNYVRIYHDKNSSIYKYKKTA